MYCVKKIIQNPEKPEAIATGSNLFSGLVPGKRI
jgi:hypothetical protein